VGGGVSDFTQNNAIFINLLSITILHNKKFRRSPASADKTASYPPLYHKPPITASNICYFLPVFLTAKRHKAGRGAGRRITRIAPSGSLCGFPLVKLKPPSAR
jgi:hypothetical protein